MPELPDLEVLAENLDKLTGGKKIKKVVVLKDKPVQPLPPAEFISFVEGKIIKSVKRTGKQQLFTFDDGNTLLVHLMLHGELHYLQAAEPLPAYAVAAFYFAENKVLVFKDHTQWLKLRLNTQGESVMDPVTKKFTLQFFRKLIQDKPKNAVKEILLNQENITGIGSAYADEICYNAKIRPQACAGDLEEKAVKLLFHAVVDTLKDAVRKIKKGMAGNITGEFTEHFAVHGKKKGKCPLGHKLETVKVGGRGSEYCPICQK